MKKTIVMAALACTVIASTAAAQSITTLFANNNRGSNGGIVYYDIDVTNPAGLNIIAFDTNIWNSLGFSFNVEIWTRVGTYVGNTGSNLGWNMAATGSGIAAATDQPSFVDTNDFPVAFGTHGIAIVLRHTNPGTTAGHTYTNGPLGPFSNADITVMASMVGGAQNVPFTGGKFSPRIWNGTIYYTVIPAPASLALLGLGGLVAVRRRR